MDTRLRHQLLELNRRFYRRRAEAFARTRSRPWPGFARVISSLAARAEPGLGKPLQVLDLGCGNGRFGITLASEAGRLPPLRDRALRYLGADAEPALLEEARAALDPLVREGSLDRAELCTVDLGQGAEAIRAVGGADRRFELIVLLGVLHHLPGRTFRRRALEALAGRLAPGGLLAASWWMLHHSPRFERKRVPWAVGAPRVDPADLEEGDTLLGWSGEWDPPRYCHFPTDAELRDLESLKGTVAEQPFESDGPTGADNLYLLWREGSGS
ncbi:MAG: class I SAM-dependent methyltransferase [Holophagales bacterium]|nr:class I SAM-dependent methyltransferase [Holophagales bacterium]